jgi:catechol 2,3-dioxygenase-like lactoylglutathione lyase family enzyme
MPELAGIHHAKLPVTDLDRSRGWYGRVLGFKVTHEFPDADGVVPGVAGEVPGLGDSMLCLRVNSAAVHGCRGLDRMAPGVQQPGRPRSAPVQLDGARGGSRGCRGVRPSGFLSAGHALTGI